MPMDFFNFTKTEFENICKEAMLNDEYKLLFEMEIYDYTRPMMARKLNVSIDTLDKMIAKLKKKIKKII